MITDVLETRINHCESNVKVFASQLDDVAQQVKNVANKINETEKVLVKVTVMQEYNGEAIKKLEHHLKNTDAAVEMIEQRQSKIETQQVAKSDLFKSWQVWLALGIGVFGAFMSIYDRIAEHITR